MLYTIFCIFIGMLIAYSIPEPHWLYTIRIRILYILKDITKK